ncbi:FliG C-terminal domain-containing protein [candidate division KSB1 bacterium]
MLKSRNKPSLKIPGKEYFIKNPEGFLFTSIFASSSINENLPDLFGDDSDILPVSIQIAPFKILNTFGKKVVAQFRYRDRPDGTVYFAAELKHLKKAASASGKDLQGFFSDLYKPADIDLSKLFGGKIDYNIEVKYSDLKKYPIGDNKLNIWIKYLVSSKKYKDFFILQCISNEFLSSVSEHFLHKPLSEETALKKEKLLGFVRELNNSYQKHLLKTISASSPLQISIETETKISKKPLSLNLEELLLVQDRTIRAILEETARRKMPLKQLAFALSGMSKDLRRKFLHNMSKNRKAEVRDALRIRKGTGDETLQAQRDIAWILIDLHESGEVKLSRNLQQQLQSLIEAMDEILFQNAEDYLNSKCFDSSIEALNDVLFQYLVRRVPRKILIPAFSLMMDQKSTKIALNMTPLAIRLISEDIKHWRKEIKEDKKILIQTAAAQQRTISESQKLIKEFRRSVF